METSLRERLDELHPEMKWGPPYSRSSLGLVVDEMRGSAGDRAFTVTERKAAPRFEVQVSRTIRELPETREIAGITLDTTYVQTARLHAGEDLAQVLDAAIADHLQSTEVLGMTRGGQHATD
jgi:hypothetical protein